MTPHPSDPRQLRSGLARRLVDLLPAGTSLPPAKWSQRHRAVCWIIGAQVPGLLLFALLRGIAPSHLLVEGALLVGVLAAAVAGRRHRLLATASGVLGLALTSAVLVHVSGGSQDMHMHFYVMVAAAALYQEYLALAMFVVFVAAHHVGMSLLDPTSVFSTPQARREPLLWALVHAAFVLGECLVMLLYWTFTESETEQTVRVQVQAAEQAALAASEQAAAAASAEREAGERLATAVRQQMEHLTEEQSRTVREASAHVRVELDAALAQAATLRTSAAGAAHELAEAHALTARATEVTRLVVDEVRALATSSSEISSVTAVISGVAAQTHLLSLNATIEAARAGQAGRGFAVVASEVKALAGETAEAAGRIGEVVDQVQGRIDTAVQAIGQLSGAIEQVSGMQGRLADLVAEQSRGTGRIEQVVASVVDTTSQLDGEVQRALSAAREL